jgi:hypothetical protein
MARRKPQKKVIKKPKYKRSEGEKRLVRTNFERERDRAIIAQYRLQGVTLWEMVNRLNERPDVDYVLTVKNVESDLRFCWQIYQKQQADSIGLLVTEQRARLQEVFRHQWQLYFEAKANKPVIEKSQKGQILEVVDPDGEVIVTPEGVKQPTKTQVIPFEVTQKEKFRDWLNTCRQLLNDIRQTVMEESKLMNDAIKSHLEMEAAMIQEEALKLSGDNPYQIEVVIEGANGQLQLPPLEEMQTVEIEAEG